jgi:hypothetical protein
MEVSRFIQNFPTIQTASLVWFLKFLDYVQSRMVAGSIPDVISFFNWSNPSSRTMVLGSTRPLTEMSTKNLPGGKWRPARKADLTAMCEPIV